jgi:hypothetical protein
MGSIGGVQMTVTDAKSLEEIFLDEMVEGYRDGRNPDNPEPSLTQGRDSELPGLRLFHVFRRRGRLVGLSARGDVFRLQCVVGQGLLNRIRLVLGSAHPQIALFRRRQDGRHGLRMNWLDSGVRRRRQKTVDEMRSGPTAGGAISPNTC